MQPSERGAPGPKPARRCAEAARPGSRQPPARPPWRSRPAGPSPARGGGRVSIPATPSPRPHLHPASSFWGNPFPRATAHHLLRAPWNFEIVVYLFGPRRGHRWFVFLPPTGTRECVRCPEGEVGSRHGGLQGCPGAVRCTHPGSKERKITPALRENGLFPAPDPILLPASVRLTGSRGCFRRGAHLPSHPAHSLGEKDLPESLFP